MVVESVQLLLSRCTVCVTMADLPHGQGRTPLNRGSSTPPQSRLHMGVVLLGRALHREDLG
eukprot:14658359-Alexandrium_andersonii.AAC.1